MLVLSAVPASAQEVRGTYHGDFTSPYIAEWWNPDYKHVPNLGDHKFSMLVAGTTRVEVGPQQNFDRYYEILKLIDHKERKVRLAAILDLKDYKTIRAARAIVSRLGDDSYEVREACAWALGEMGYRSAIRPLIDALQYTYGDKTFLANALRKLTGKNFGQSYRRWWAWYEVVRRDS